MQKCAEIHSRLDSSITKVKSTSDGNSWTEEECTEMMKKGNAHGNNLLEKFIPGEYDDNRTNCVIMALMIKSCGVHPNLSSFPSSIRGMVIEEKRSICR